MAEESWRSARLIPTSGIGSADEQERRATSARLVEGPRSLYGDTNDVTWREADGFFDLALRTAARQQHEAAILVNGHLKKQKISRESLSRRLGRGEDHIGRKLRGEEWADLRDLAEWALAFDDQEILTGGELGDELQKTLVTLPADQGKAS